MTARVRFGLGPLTGQSAQQHDVLDAHRELTIVLNAVLAAERHGFDGAWVSEHHLTNDGHLNSPLLLLAAVATRTRAITLGTAVALAPLYSPVRLAEDACFVNTISDGRLLLGLGTGYRHAEFLAFDVEKPSRFESLTDAVAAVRRSADGEDALAQAERRPTGPPPGPVVLLGGFAEPAVRRAARIADGWIAPTLESLTELEERLGWLDDEGVFRREAFHVVVNVAAFVASASAWTIAREGILYVERRYAEWKAANGVATAERHEHSQTPTARPPSHVVVGTPDECIARIRPWYDLLSTLPDNCIPWINVRLHYPRVGETATIAAVALFADDVIPELRKADHA